MRKLAVFAFSAAGAIALYQYFSAGIVFAVAGAVCAALLCAQRFGLRRTASLLAVLGISFGLFYSAGYELLIVNPVDSLAGYEGSACVTLCAYPEATTYGAKGEAYLHTDSFIPVKVEVYGTEALLSCKPGDDVNFSGELRSAAMVRDQRVTTFTSKGIRLLAYVDDETILPAAHLPMRYLPLLFAQRVKEQIALLYAPSVAPLLTALLTGDRGNFSNALYSDLTESGIIHVTAVSGMHCAFLYGAVALVIRRKKQAALVGIPLLLCFCLMVGATPSVTRACFMLILLMIAPLVDRENDSLTTLSAALLILLLYNPCSVASVSLQMSFAAVAGILLVSGRMYLFFMKRRMEEKTQKGYLIPFVVSTFCATCGASVFTIPLSAYYFGCVSLIAPLANVLCLWAAEAAFLIGGISVLLSFLWLPLGQLLSIFSTAALSYFQSMAHLLSGIPHHALYSVNPLFWMWIAFAYAIAVCAFIGRKKSKGCIPMACGLVATMLAVVILLPVALRQQTTLTAAVLDVGQGESVLLASGKDALLVDCGSSNSWIGAGGVAADELNTLGYTRLSGVVFSHYHNDHVNGLNELLARVRVDRLILPNLQGEKDKELRDAILRLAAEYEVPVEYAEQTQTIAFGDAELTIYPPCGTGETNEEGLSVLCGCGDFQMLITGDMDRTTESILLQREQLPDIDLLVVGHHGSDTSSGTEFLSAVAPEEAVISVGSNSYGHPSGKTMGRLLATGAEIYRTDQNGTVTIRVY